VDSQVYRVDSKTTLNSGATNSASSIALTSSSRATNWPITIVMCLFHAGAVAALFMLNWQAVAVAAVLYWLAIGCGIGMGYHRLLTHRSYEVPKVIEYWMAICGTLTLEGGPISWVATHRIHHQKSDKEGDPHSPRDGGWWAHAGWILTGKSNHNDTPRMSRYAPDLARDRFYVWLNTFHYVPLIALGLILLAVGGLPMMLWGVCVRVVIGLHATWLVNSAAHMWGRRRFATSDDSRNNWWVALLTFGEGWHNNHHAHPTSARHGLRWYEFDVTWMQIRFLQLVGLVKSAKVPNLGLSATPREAARQEA
jgi:stearoyl-CoA desaturase (delta-9 desaturase)